jgi:hypothetical protein
MVIKRTQIRSYDIHDAAQEKILPDLIENDEDPLQLTSLLSNLDKIRSTIRKISGENYWSDDPSTNLKALSSRTFTTSITDTWSIVSRLQGIIIAPEGPVSDDGAGNIILPNILVSNPLTGTFVRIQALTAYLGENSYIYFDLPPDSNSNETISATVVLSDPFNPPTTPPYSSYPSENRVVLAQRIGSGKVWFRFSWAVPFFTQ